MTIFEAYNSTKARLKSAGKEDNVFEANQIIKAVTGYDNKEILLNYTASLADFQIGYLEEILKQREEGYPLQYILGFWDFYGRRYKVGPGVLIPRQDTEIVVETCLELIKDIKAPEILDLCAGTGCIGITLADEKENSSVTLVEKYSEAVEYLTENIKQNSSGSAKLIKGDIFEKCGADKKYDLIVSNPPYIKTQDIAKLQPEVRFEPMTALDGGKDGLDFYRVIIEKSKRCFKGPAHIIFEIGYDQGAALTGLSPHPCTIKKDLSGNDRVCIIRG